ncbi:MAG: hypothetical protein ABFD89_03090, partial [Bryobacteraceae bacterium]
MERVEVSQGTWSDILTLLRASTETHRSENIRWFGVRAPQYQQTVYGIKLGDEDEVDPAELGDVIIFADELNKYAPKSGDSKRSLTQSLLEITERGRSLGTVLFGAEQFRSGVHDRVLGNCSTNVYGRTSPLEIAKCPDYQFFPATYKTAITHLPKGSLLL